MKYLQISWELLVTNMVITYPAWTIIIPKLSFQSENVDIKMQFRDRRPNELWTLKWLGGNFTSRNNFILNNMNEGKATGAIFLDLKKAFDTINDDLLIKKLEKYMASLVTVLNGLFHIWMKDFKQSMYHLHFLTQI